MSHVDDFVDVERHVGKSTLVEVVFVPSASKEGFGSSVCAEVLLWHL